MTSSSIIRGEVLQIDLDPTIGTEIKKIRPCVVVQNNIGNRVSPRTIIVPITGAEHVGKPFPIYVPVAKGQGGLTKDSIVLCDQIRVVDKKRLVRSLGHLSPSTMEKVDTALKISLGLK